MDFFIVSGPSRTCRFSRCFHSMADLDEEVVMYVEHVPGPMLSLPICPKDLDVAMTPKHSLPEWKWIQWCCMIAQALDFVTSSPVNVIKGAACLTLLSCKLQDALHKPLSLVPRRWPGVCCLAARMAPAQFDRVPHSYFHLGAESPASPALRHPLGLDRGLPLGF